jgi:hypothetical protein
MTVRPSAVHAAAIIPRQALSAGNPKQLKHIAPLRGIVPQQERMILLKTRVVAS